MSDEITNGDDQEVACPWCDKDQCLQDPHTDGVLTRGYRFECDDCGKPIKVIAVDYDVTVWLKRDVADEAKR